jgi:hypothetical protein
LAGCAYFGLLAFTTISSGRLEGVGGAGVDDANAFAMQMSTGVVVGGMVALTVAGIRRWFAIAVLPFILNGIILSGSRGGFLALICGGFVLWRLKPRASRRLFYAFACLGVVLFLGLARDPLFWERMQSIEAVVSPGDAEIDDSALSRQIIIEAQLKMARAYPLGTGSRGTLTLSPEYIPDRFLAGPEEHRGRSSHNTFMTALVEQGIPGAICYLWIWLWTAAAVIRVNRHDWGADDTERRSQLAAVAAGLAIVFVAGIFVDYISTEVQFWLWAMLASMLAAANPVLRTPERVPAAAPPAQASTNRQQ